MIMIAREVLETIPEHVVRRLQFECKTCEFKTFDRKQGAFHRAKAHIAPLGKAIRDVGVAYLFKNQEDMQEFWDYVNGVQDCNLYDRWKGPGWYIYQSDGYIDLVFADEILTDLDNDVFEIQEKIDAIETVTGSALWSNG